MKFGDQITKLRKDKKLSQEELAEALGVTRQTISNWENYKNYPDIAMLSMISDKYKISLDDLLKKDVDLVKKIDKNIKRGKHNIIAIIITIVLLFSVVGTYLGTHAYYYNQYKGANYTDFRFLYPAINIDNEYHIYTIPGEKQDNIDYINYHGLHIKNDFKSYTKDETCMNKWDNGECELQYNLDDESLPLGMKSIRLSIYDKIDVSGIKEDTMWTEFDNFSKLFDVVSDLSKYNFYDINFFTPIKKMKNEYKMKEIMNNLTCDLEDTATDKTTRVYNAAVLSGKYIGVASYSDSFGEFAPGYTQIIIEHNNKTYQIDFDGYKPNEIQALLNTVYID